MQYISVIIRVGMWEGISRPGNGRDGMGGKEIKISVPRGRPGGRTKGLREPGGTPRSRQDTKNRNITKNRSLLKIETFISFSILARLGRF